MSAKAVSDSGPQLSHTGSPVLIPGPGDESQEPFFQPVHLDSSAKQKPPSTDPTPLLKSQKLTGQDTTSTGHTGSAPYPPAPAAGASLVMSDQSYRDLPPQKLYEELSGDEEESNLEEGEASSKVVDRQDQTEDMTYRETVRSVRSFMGWSHIPVYESDLSEPDKSNNPWKGKNPKKPARLSVAMPPDDWLCQKLERLNTTVAEGYPSRAQDSTGLKKDQFVKIPHSQSRWYQMHTLRPDGPHRPGKSLFSWSDQEAKVNSQFPRLIKASAYSPSGPPSRPISQDYLCHWERCAREGSYVVNSAAGFNRCSSELHERISSGVSFLQSKVNKGKAPKDFTDTLKDVRDYVAFQQSVSVAMGTALQHLADSLFVHLSNIILLRRDSYLEHVKPGIKPDTLNNLRNGPLFGHGLFPDSVLATAEQDIARHESAGVAPGPGPGASQRSSWRGSARYRPYDHQDNRQSSTQGDQGQQPWRQFSRNRNRGRGRGRGGNPRFSKSRGNKSFK